MHHPIPEDPPEDEYFFYEEFRPRRRFRTYVEDRELPWSREAERAVISAMLQWPEDVVSELVQAGGPDLFYLESHRILCETVVHLAESGNGIDLVTLGDELRHRNLLDRIGGPGELGGLFCEVPCMTNLGDWLSLLREYRAKRKLLEASDLIRESVGDESLPLPELLDRAERDILAIRGAVERPVDRTMKDTVMTVIEGMDRALRDAGRISGLATGFRDWDALTGGFHPGELTVIAGPPGIGKSTLATNLVERTALSPENPFPVAWFPLQDTAEQATERLIVSRAGMNLHDFRSGRFSPKHGYSRFFQSASDVADAPIQLDNAQTGITQLRHRVRRWRETAGTGMLVIDGLQLLRGDPRRGWSSFELELAEISAGLKGLARELQIPVITFAALSGSFPGAEDAGQPNLQTLSNLWPVLDDADSVACLWPGGEEENSEVQVRELHLLKQRNGPLGTVFLHFEPRASRFRDASPDSPAEEADADWANSPGGSVVVTENGQVFPAGEK